MADINLQLPVFCCVLLMLAQDYCHDFTGGSLSPSERVIGDLIQHYLSKK